MHCMTVLRIFQPTNKHYGEFSKGQKYIMEHETVNIVQPYTLF